MNLEFNRHLREFRADFTIEFNVKNPNLPEISEEAYSFELETGTVINKVAEELFNKLNYKWLEDWSFAGRSGGWFVLICSGEQSQVQQRTLCKLEQMVEDYLKIYTKELEAAYI